MPCGFPQEHPASRFSPHQNGSGKRPSWRSVGPAAFLETCVDKNLAPGRIRQGADQEPPVKAFLPPAGHSFSYLRFSRENPFAGIKDGRAQGGSPLARNVARPAVITHQPHGADAGAQVRFDALPERLVGVGAQGDFGKAHIGQHFAECHHGFSVVRCFVVHLHGIDGGHVLLQHRKMAPQFIRIAAGDQIFDVVERLGSPIANAEFDAGDRTAPASGDPSVPIAANPSAVAVHHLVVIEPQGSVCIHLHGEKKQRIEFGSMAARL
jgi:hypothetical protein